MAALSISHAMSGGGKSPGGQMSGFGGGKPMAQKPQQSSGGHYEIHPHEDGSAHSMTPDGQQTEHPSMHHAMAHIAGHHDSEGAHSMVHHHMEGHTSHHSKGGNVTGPHENASLDEVKQKMQEVAGEGGESGGEQAMSTGESEGGSGKGLFA